MINTRVRKFQIAVVVSIITALILIYWPTLRWMVNSWLYSEYYTHGFLVPLISGFFIWTKRKQLTDREPSAGGYLFLVVALALFVSGLFWEIRVLNALSIVIAIIGLVMSIWGVKIAKILAFPLLFLLFMVPFAFVQELASDLQYVSVHWAAGIAAILQLPIETIGTEIYLGNNISFTVGIVCSGINTLMALLALSAVYAHILKGPIPKRVGLFVFAIPIAIGANILRISSIIIVAYFSNVETATGWYHDISSPLFFFIAFMVLVLIGWLMKFSINYQFINNN